ncbi:MAG: acetyl-CoA C-acetyltransferase [Pseudomonadota bacterium]
MDSRIVITGAARTPIGAFGGGLVGLSAAKLGEIAITEALARSQLDPGHVDEVIMGQILTAGDGQNPARQAAIHSGIPEGSTALTINQVCGSGLRAVAMAAQSLALRDADIVVAGGQENMSASAHCARLRRGLKLGDGTLIDTMMRDGLLDAFSDVPMGITAENIAQRWQISREDQDAFACESQQKCAQAIKQGRFAQEIVPIKTKKTTITTDEHPRPETTRDSLAGLSPVFAKQGTVTAGNASGINDGAAALVLMREEDAIKRRLKPLVRIATWATAGVEPAVMGTGPIPAVRKALKRIDWDIDALELIESNEAFAVQACAVNRELGWNTDRVNVNGGAIALGHPIGASGARILITLLYEMIRRDAQRGLATLCIGGGMGIALAVDREGL